MDREAKKLKKMFEKHRPPEELKARKQAGKLRKNFKKDKGDAGAQRITEDNWESLLDQHGHARKRPSITELMARLDDHVTAEEVDESERANAAIVMSVSSGRCRVFHGGREIDCVVPPEMAIRQKSALAVGDRVRFSEEGEVAKL